MSELQSVRLADNLVVELSDAVHSSDFAENVLDGLSKSPKRLSSVYFYDKTGSQLFEQICELPEYYLTRTEFGILQDHSLSIAAHADSDLELVELGSGSSTKTRLLIEALLARQRRLTYRPIDISRTMLVESARELLESYPELGIEAHAGEYESGINRIAQIRRPKMVAFLGSSLGNFEPAAAREFLASLRSALSRRDTLLLGTDMRKSPEILQAAYNDSQGVTAQFNLNLLTRINRELGGRFDTDRFGHMAFFNDELGRIEMHLESRMGQMVSIDKLGRSFHFKSGERIHSENSYKYSASELERLGQASGFGLVEFWSDPRDYFRLSLFRPI